MLLLCDQSVTAKCCCRCRRLQSLENFHRDSRTSDGRAGACKECKKERRKPQLQRNRIRPIFSINEMNVTPEIEARFWSYADSSGDCWLWLGSKINGRYGKFSVRRREFTAHRVSYRLANGSIPDGMHILHRCDNPACVNPSHLFAGTNQDNIADRVAKGRSNRQPKKVYTTIEQVKEIRTRHASGEKSGQIAKSMSIPPNRVYSIVSRRVWKDVEG